MYKRIALFIFLLSLAVFPACDTGASEADLPPDPGEEGKQTLEGIDSDGDGVRDDVQRYIFMNYQDEPTRRALVQYAKAELRAVQIADDKEGSIKIFDEVARAIECLTSIYPDEAPRISAKLVSVMFNTKARIEAYVKSSDQGAGHTFSIRNPSDWPDSCPP